MSTTFLVMPNNAEVQRALDEGARRSREACALTAAERELFVAVSVGVTSYQVAGEAITPEYLWRRFKWPLIGLGLFLLIELLSLGKLISVMGTKF